MKIWKRYTHGEGALEGDLVSLNALNGGRGDAGLAIDKHGCDVNGLPRDRCLQFSLVKKSLAYRRRLVITNLDSSEDVLHSLGDLRTNTVTFNDGDREVSLCAIAVS